MLNWIHHSHLYYKIIVLQVPLCSACVLEVLQCSHGQNCPDPSNHILSFLTGFQGLGLKSKPVGCVLWLCLCVQSQWKQLLLSFSSAGYSHPALSAQWNLVYELWVSRSTSSVRCESWSPQHQASFETWWLPAKCPLGVKKHFSSQIKTSLEAAKRCYSCIACVPREEPREFKCFEHMKKDVRNYNNTAKQGFLFCFVD